MSRWTLGWLVALTGVGLVAVAMYYTLPAPAATLQEKHANYKLFVDVLEEIQKNHARELKPEEIRNLIEGMINGGLRDFDQHSYFYNREAYRELKTHTTGSFIGIGIQIGMSKDERLMVISPIVGTPAYEAGLLAGDLILKINGASTDKMDIEEAKKRIVGEPDTKVTLTILHPGAKEPVDKVISRQKIDIENVMGDRRNPANLKEWDFFIDGKMNIAYVRINQFTGTTTHDMVKVVESLKKLGMRGLVLDLRGNPGGLLKAAVEVSSLFLKEGQKIVSTKGRAKGDEQVYTSSAPIPGYTPDTDYPIAVLLNRGSASASEILAAALQEHMRAVVVGERSYGKGSVQQVLDLEGGESALKITTALWFTPQDRNINRESPVWNKDDKAQWGVLPSPGYEVDLTLEELRDAIIWRRDRDIVRRDKDGKEPKAAKGEFKDKVLEKALEYIRGKLGERAAADLAVPADVASVRPASPLLPTMPWAGTAPRADAAVERGRTPAILNRAPVVR